MAILFVLSEASCKRLSLCLHPLRTTYVLFRGFIQSYITILLQLTISDMIVGLWVDKDMFRDVKLSA